MGIPWETSHGMGWDRYKLLWDGNGTDKYVPWTTLVFLSYIALLVENVQSLSQKILNSNESYLLFSVKSTKYKFISLKNCENI